jgi:hypothetical protein
MIEHGAGPGGVLPCEADVDAAGEVGGGELVGIAGVKDLGALRLHGEDGFERERLHLPGERLIERGALLAVEHGVIGEIGRSFRLIGGDHADEGVLGHGLQSVVPAALLAHGGYGFLADGLAAERACAVGRIDQALVGQGQQFFVQGIEEHAAEVGGGPAERDAQIGAAYIADEQRVAGEHAVGQGVAGAEVINNDGDRLGSVAGCLERLETHAAELEQVAIVKRRKCVGGLRGAAEVDGCARAIAQLEVASDEVGVKVREEDVPDLQPVLGGERDVLVGVALRIDHGCRAGRLVPNEIGGVRQARQIELLEDHLAPTGSGFFSRLTRRR